MINFEEKKSYEFFKRIQDVVFSVVALIVLLPVFLIISIAIYVDSPGDPVIFRQIRVGKNGKQFVLYKFRTMCVGAEAQLESLKSSNEMDGPVFKIKDDPRITPVGKFLRRSALDELPQLINVIHGDMSVVGPRPPLVSEVAQYNAYQRQRLLVRPGMTCYWQVSHEKNSLSFDDWMKLDMRYIENRSFLLDWKLIFKTFYAMINLEGL